MSWNAGRDMGGINVTPHLARPVAGRFRLWKYVFITERAGCQSLIYTSSEIRIHPYNPGSYPE